eukprot:scaffold1424_cov359-Prasinococcus_capsulatus_cf.AAC.7
MPRCSVETELYGHTTTLSSIEVQRDPEDLVFAAQKISVRDGDGTRKLLNGEDICLDLDVAYLWTGEGGRGGKQPNPEIQAVGLPSAYAKKYKGLYANQLIGCRGQDQKRVPRKVYHNNHSSRIRSHALCSTNKPYNAPMQIKVAKRHFKKEARKCYSGGPRPKSDFASSPVVRGWACMCRQAKGCPGYHSETRRARGHGAS